MYAIIVEVRVIANREAEARRMLHDMMRSPGPDTRRYFGGLLA